MTVLPGILAIPGVGVGSVTRRDLKTGTTVVVLPSGARGSVDVGGGAPATRETPVLEPTNTIPGPDAVVLTGGSAIGLRSADGVVEVLQQLNRGVEVGPVRIPIVVAAAIFDMGVGRPEAPTVDDGKAAAMEANSGNQTVVEGRHGAGTGATVGKILGPSLAMPGGQGAVTLTTQDGLIVGAVVVVNAVGSVVDEVGTILAGPRTGERPESTLALLAYPRPALGAGGATSIGLVVTNAGFSKAELGRVARMSHDGLARAIEPVHTPWDGDTLFAVSVGERADDVGRVGALAAYAVALAVRRAVRVSMAEEEREQ
ncbi:P1 family peptidase [Sulfobacillus sp. DSM 109850]|uniref:P1 family peptidase n=1 Tax=Sulfobacillus harzensis TaxID=2729629 RepID=A0A7Y0L838_9FIRM|nr:P1 family peptidase [Sulfobacillus harzensis]